MWLFLAYGHMIIRFERKKVSCKETLKNFSETDELLIVVEQNFVDIEDIIYPVRDKPL